MSECRGTRTSMKKNYIFNLIYQLLSIIMPFITTPYVSRVLHADGIGAYSYTISTITYIGIFAILGMSTYGQLEVAKLREDKYQCSKLFWGIVCAKGITTIAAVTVYYVLTPILGIYVDIYKLMIIYFIAQLIDFTWFFQGFEEFGFIVARNIAIKVIGTLCIFLFVKKPEDILLYTIIIQGTALLGNALMCPRLRRFLVRVPFKEIKVVVHWKESLIFFIPTIATSVYTLLDKSMIGWLTKSAFENGYYEQAHKIEQIVVVVVTSLNVVTLPRVVHLFHEGLLEDVKQIINKSVKFVLCIAFPMCIGLAAVSKDLIPIFLGQGYEPCILLVEIFAFLIIIVGLSNLISGQCLTATGKQKDANICVIVGALINFGLNIFLIPRLGATGAAIATVSAETIILIMFLCYSKQYVSVAMIMKLSLKYFACSLIMGAVVLWVGCLPIGNEILSLLLQILAGGLIYLLMLVLMKDTLLAEAIKLCKQLKKK